MAAIDASIMPDEKAMRWLLRQGMYVCYCSNRASTWWTDVMALEWLVSAEAEAVRINSYLSPNGTN